MRTFRQWDLIKIGDLILEITDIEGSNRKYHTFPKPGAKNAMGRVTNEAAVDITEGSSGYAKPVNSDESPKRMSFSNAELIKRPDLKLW